MDLKMLGCLKIAVESKNAFKSSHQDLILSTVLE